MILILDQQVKVICIGINLRPYSTLRQLAAERGVILQVYPLIFSAIFLLILAFLWISLNF